jgi:hypothetical protein
MAGEACPLWAHVVKAPEHDLLDEMQSFSLLLDSGKEEQPVAAPSETMGPRFRHDSATAR